ncbi:MAG TPA: HAD hydrolase family protein [Desulfomicrobiaceae bacterium]|nr:HAD hydrolase family protein [Desulfomicrobiaceae bacterium]
MPVSEAAKKVRMVILDVDGVLTDGGLYYDADGNVSKRFSVQDGLGIKLAQSVGIEFAVITGLNSTAVEERAKGLGIRHYFSGHHRKIPILEELRDRTGIGFSEMAYIGDDWVDAGPLSLVGLPVAVANAQPEIREMAALVTSASGGNGAVREALRFILAAQGKLEALWADWKGRP